MKRQLLHNIVIILFLFPISLFAQPSLTDNDITGLWKGSLYNDTTNKYLPYEIAISHENGKLSGYSYTLFDIDGKKELGVKRIKIKRKDDQLFMEDIALILNDYSEPPPRKVRQQSVVNLSANDTAMQMTGTWSTNRTREYRPLTGTMQLKRAIDFRPMVLFKKLVELKLDMDLSFVKADIKREQDIAKKEIQIAEIKPPVITPSLPTSVGNPTEIPANVADKKTGIVIENKPASIVIKPRELPIVNPPAIDKARAISSPVAAKSTAVRVIKDSVGIKIKPADVLVNKPAGNPPKIIAAVTEKKKEVVVAAIDSKKENSPPPVNKPTSTPPTPVAKKAEPLVIIKEPSGKEKRTAAEIVMTPVPNKKPELIKPPLVNNNSGPVSALKEKEVFKKESSATAILAPAPEQKKELPVAAINTAAANVSERKMNNAQSVFFESDSLVLTLYDNGDVDGDTVSVLMNGQIIFAKQGLSTKANSKTIYTDKAMPDSLSMVMYAENLGSIPPNTGLMVIMDGEKRYEVRFSADLKTNAAILLRRRPKE